LEPSTRNASGANIQAAPIVAAPNSSGAVCFVLSRFAFESTALSPENKFEVIAALNDKGLNDRSVAMATATPPTTGTKAAYTGKGKISPRTTAFTAAEKSGSRALTTCVMDTAPAPKEMTVVTCWPQCATATGQASLTAALTDEGPGRPMVHPIIAYRAPTTNCAHETNQGSPTVFSTFLLMML